MTGQGTIVAAGSIAYPPEWSHADPARIGQLGVSKVMTLTSTYDHRIIQGAESGNFLKTLDGLLAGGSEFYENGRRLTSASTGPSSPPPSRRRRWPRRLPSPVRPAPSAIAEAPSPELLQAVQAATSLLKAYRTHGHLAAHLDPLGAEAEGRPGARPRDRRT